MRLSTSGNEEAASLSLLPLGPINCCATRTFVAIAIVRSEAEKEASTREVDVDVNVLCVSDQSSHMGSVQQHTDPPDVQVISLYCIIDFGKSGQFVAWSISLGALVTFGETNCCKAASISAGREMLISRLS